MIGSILPGLSSALLGMSVAAFALWLLASSQLRVEALERRILGRRFEVRSVVSADGGVTHSRTATRCPGWFLAVWPVWLAGTIIGGPVAGFGLVSGGALLLAAWLSVAARGRRRTLAIEVQALIRDLHLLASSGDTAVRCLRLAVERCDEPLLTLLSPALLAIQAGQSVLSAVGGIPELVTIPEYAGLVHALWLHLETGASLSLLLAESAERSDESALLRSETDSKLAEARSTARILAIVPLAVAAYLAAFNRAVITPLLLDPAGKLALVIGSVLWVAGVCVVSRMQVPPAELGGESW